MIAAEMPGTTRTVGQAIPRVLTGIVFALGLSFSTGVLAQVQRSFVNLGFEQPDLTTNGCRVYINSSQVPGWQTTHPNNATENSGGCVVTGGLGASPGPILELWRTPRNNSSGGTVNAPEGVQIAELNAAAASRIYQNVCLVNGEQVNWRFSHRGRGSATTRDIAEMKIGASSTVVRVGTTNSGAFDTPVVFQGAVNTPVSIAGNTSWVRYTGGFTYAGATGVSNLGFEAISAQGGASNGNLLDDIQIALAPFVEFTQPSSSTPESASNNRPTLRVNGTVLAAFTVTVNITGGTASRPADYTTPGNFATVTVNVPAGNYDGTSAGSLFPLPVTVVNDTAAESNETIQFQIAPASGATPAYQLFSNTTCGGPAQTTWTYTIVDDDARITVIKDVAAPVAVAGSLSLFDVAYTIVVNNPSGTSAPYTLIDTPGLDPNVSIVSASSVRSNSGGGSGGGAASLTLTGSGPWSLTSANRILTAGATDTYTLTVRMQINQGGPASNDTCATPSVGGSGLHNSVTATLQAAGNPTFTDSACRNTPTPVWATLRKQLQGRNAATDQFQVRLFSSGIPTASATTSGSATPSTASTGQQILSAGTTLQFEEALKANGTGADQIPSSYTTLLTCTNATTGSTTVLPGGTGTALVDRQQWPEFTPAAGDVLDCVITNTPGGANLSITKTNTPGVNGNIDQAGDTVIQGATTTYTLVVRNSGPASANGAVVRDTPAAGLSCGTATCAAAGASQCPTATDAAALASALQSGAGATIPLLPAGAANTVTFTLTCQVQ